MTDLRAIADALDPHWRTKAAIRRDLFDRQLALYDHPARRKAAHPGRRAGKSTGLPAFAAMDALDCKAGEVVILGGETKQKAESLYRAPLNAIVHAKGLPFSFNGKLGAFMSDRRDGSGIYLWGIADKGAADMLRGFKVRAAYLDEVATFAQHLRYLADDVLGPALGDLDGTLTYAGTPSLTRSGPWYELCAGLVRGWQVFHWDVRQNVRFPRDPREVLEEEAERYGGWDNATFQREWLGVFVDDPAMQVYRWTDAINGCDRPAYDPATWSTTLGVDFGFSDECAWVVLGSHKHDRTVYELHAEKHGGLLVDDACERTAALVKAWGVTGLVGDAGGLGKPYVEQWNARYARDGVPPMIAAEKTEKRAAIELWNGEARAGRIRTDRLACRELVEERLSLPWKDTTKQHEDPRYANHLTDAGLYAWRHHHAYLNAAPVRKTVQTIAPDSDEADERDERRVLRKGREWWDT